jgi:hypothetical protein
MKIWRRGHIGVEHKAFLEANHIKHKAWSTPRIGAKVDKVDDYMFEITESDPAWPELKNRIGAAHTYVGTQFEDSDRLNAAWCIIWENHSIESLQFEGRGWHDEYYSDGCPACGSGWRQIKPYKIKKEPKLGKNQFCGFGSGFELFCTPLILEEFAKVGIGGFETWPILFGKLGERVKTLSQMIVSAVAEPAIVEELVERERYGQTDCPVCGRVWHAHYVRGMLPLRRAALIANVDFQLTNEWFGNGRTARREILVSQRVVRLILENKWKGVWLIPIQSV